MTDQQSLDGKNLSDRLEILKEELDVILSRMPGYEAELDSNKAGAINCGKVHPEPVTRPVGTGPPEIIDQ